MSLYTEMSQDGIQNSQHAKQTKSSLNQKKAEVPQLSRAQGLLICIIFSWKYRLTFILSNNFVWLQVTFKKLLADVAAQEDSYLPDY